MPVSEKEIIERLPDWIAEKKTSFLFGSGTSAPGMPLMNMFPGKKDGSTDVDGLMYEIIKRNKFLIGAKMKINVSEEESKAILGTLGAYKKFKPNLKDLAERKNLRFLCPKDFSFHGEEFSRLDLNNFNKIIAGKLKCA